jgi:NAD(P)-dependent dehydrogenase (short-subunit alcohol dehydrogenase family)
MKIEAGMCAFVTGAGSGIGRGIAMSLARRGVRVGVCDIQRDDAAATACLIEADGGMALPVEVDVSD